jgi:single-strand DNA-binding protein
MKNVAEFTIIGRVSTTKALGKVTKVVIASNYRIKDEDRWVEDTHWNEVTVFAKSTQAYIDEHVAKGDLVHVRGRIRQNSYERNGSRVFTVDLVATEFSRLAQGSERVRGREAA